MVSGDVQDFFIRHDAPRPCQTKRVVLVLWDFLGMFGSGYVSQKQA